MTRRARRIVHVEPMASGDLNKYIKASIGDVLASDGDITKISRANECNHCWHMSPGAFYFGHPPRMAQVCCHCGEKRPEPLPYPFDGVQHGPYMPKMAANLNSLMGGATWIDTDGGGAE